MVLPGYRQVDRSNGAARRVRAPACAIEPLESRVLLNAQAPSSLIAVDGRPSAISADGSTVVGNDETGRPFTWTAAGGLQHFGTFQNTPTTVTAVNADGS